MFYMTLSLAAGNHCYTKSSFPDPYERVERGSDINSSVPIVLTLRPASIQVVFSIRETFNNIV